MYPLEKGRKVTEVTTTWVSNITYEAQIATRGPLGIETENYYQIFFMNIEDVFPNKYVSATILRRIVGTTVDVTISRIPPPTDSQDGKPAEPEILSFHSFTSSNLTGLNPKEHVEARAAFPAKDPVFAVVQEGLTVNFFGYGNQGVPADTRAQKMILFRSKLLLDDEIPFVIRGISALTYDPNQDALDNVKFRMYLRRTT